MNFFRKTLYYCAILGISAHQSKQPHPFNGKIVLGFFAFGCCFISHFVCIFWVTSEYDVKYVEKVTVASGAFIMFTCFASMVFNMAILFESFDMFEEVLGKSE